MLKDPQSDPGPIRPGHVSPWVVALAFAVAIVAVWVPFDLNRLDMSDTYPNMFKLELAPDLLAPLIVHESARYLNYIPMGVGYWLTPDSLVGQQFALALVLWFKALCVFLFVRRAVPSLGGYGAAFAGLFATLYPGDTDFFYFTTTHNHLTVALLFLSGERLLKAQDVAADRLPFGLMMALGLTLTLTLAPNEGNHPVVALLPLACLWLKRWSLTRNRLLVFAWWYAVQALWVLVYLAHLVLGLTRFSESLTAPKEGVAFLAGMGKAFVYLFSGAWASLAAPGPAFWAMAAVAAVAAGLLLTRARLQPPAPRTRDALWLAALGVAVILAGYFPYSITPKNFTWSHTLFLSTTGAAFLLTAVVSLLLTRTPRLWAPVLVGGLAVLLKGAISDHARYVELVGFGERNLETVVRAVPSFAPETQFLFVLDRGVAPGNNAWRNAFGMRLWHPVRYRKPLEYVYSRSGRALDYCVLHPGRGPQLGCSGEPGRVRLGSSGEPLATERVVAFRISREGVVSFLPELPRSRYLPRRAAERYAPERLIRRCLYAGGRGYALFDLGLPICDR